MAGGFGLRSSIARDERISLDHSREDTQADKSCERAAFEKTTELIFLMRKPMARSTITLNAGELTVRDGGWLRKSYLEEVANAIGETQTAD
jgi:hypothetical protein